MPLGDKWHQLRDKIARASADVIGMQLNEAVEHVNAPGLQCRVISSDDEGCMITADVRMDRIGLVVWKGSVVGTKNG